jgi:hypothetical protein
VAVSKCIIVYFIDNLVKQFGFMPRGRIPRKENAFLTPVFYN